MSAALSTLPLEVSLAKSASALSSFEITSSAVDSLDSADDIWPCRLESSPSSCPALCAAATPAVKASVKNAINTAVRRCEKSGRFICLIPKCCSPGKFVALTKINATVTSRESKYLRNFRDAGKRANPRRAALDRRRRIALLAIDQHCPHPQRRSGREIEMLRVADMHRVVRGNSRACEGSVVNLAT